MRNRQTVDFARHDGITVLTCQPADPATEGGSESTVKLAKADLVPTETNLLVEYSSFAELEAACTEFGELINARVHRGTRRAPAAMLAEEQQHLHRVPDTAHTVAFGLSRQVPTNTPAKMVGTAEVDQALGQAAINQRFAHDDLASILAAGATAGPTHTADESTSLTQGTSGWAGLGTNNTGTGTAAAGESATDRSNA